MVAGKSSPAATASLNRAVSSPHLPPLPKLRVRRPDRAQTNPCLGVMTSMLGCWASQGQMAQGCAVLEQQLRGCMDVNKGQMRTKSQINSTLSRFYPKMVGPTKRK